MTFEEAYDTLPGNGWLSREEAHLLWLAVQRTTGPILEVGCFQGRSTCLLAATGRTVYAVDPFDGFHSELTGDEIERLFLANLAGRGIKNVLLFRQKIEEWRPQPAGFVYCDGDHTYAGTRAQIRCALCCRPEMIAVHDVNDQGGGMDIKRACLEILGPWGERVERLAVWRLA